MTGRPSLPKPLGKNSSQANRCHDSLHLQMLSYSFFPSSYSMNSPAIPYEISDSVNARILAVSEDKLQGFQREPLHSIARHTGLEVPVVLARIQAMLHAGTIRRVRQTLLATNLAQGALVAWQVPVDKLEA